MHNSHVLLSDIKHSYQKCIDELTEITNAHLIDNGLTCESSQRTCVLNGILHLDHLINGVCADDLKEKYNA